MRLRAKRAIDRQEVSISSCQLYQTDMADSSGRGHLTGGTRRKRKSSPALPTAPLAPPRLPEHLLDGLSGDEEESERKRPRSTSTTPKSGHGARWVWPSNCQNRNKCRSAIFPPIFWGRPNPPPFFWGFPPLFLSEKRCFWGVDASYPRTLGKFHPFGGWAPWISTFGRLLAEKEVFFSQSPLSSPWLALPPWQDETVVSNGFHSLQKQEIQGNRKR